MNKKNPGNHMVNNYWNEEKEGPDSSSEARLGMMKSVAESLGQLVMSASMAKICEYTQTGDKECLKAAVLSARCSHMLRNLDRRTLKEIDCGALKNKSPKEMHDYLRQFEKRKGVSLS